MSGHLREATDHDIVLRIISQSSDRGSSKSLEAILWSLAAELGAKALPPVSLIVLARLLVPADFGVVAAASVVVSFASMFWDAGLGQALIHRKTQVEEAANVVFWTNFGLAAVLYGLLVVSSAPLARFFGDARVQAVVCVQGLVLFPSACAAVFASSHRKELDFRRLFWVRSLTAIVPLISSVPLALAGWGYWALVVGTLAGAFLNLVTLWLGSRVKIRWSYDRKVAREMWAFGMFVMGESLLAWLYAWGDSVLIGRFFSMDELGVYRAANSVVTMVFAVAVMPVFPVLFPLFARASDVEELRRKLLEVVAAISALSWLVGAMFAFNSEFITSVALGGRWTGAASLIAMLGILNGISYYSLAGNEAMRAAGHAKSVFFMMLMALSYSVPVWIWSVQQGVETFLQARLLLLIPGHALMFYFYRKRLGIAARAWFRNVSGNLAAVAVVCLGGVALWLFDCPPIPRFVAMTVLAAGYGFVVLRTNPPVKRVLDAILSRVSARLT